MAVRVRRRKSISREPLGKRLQNYVRGLFLPGDVVTLLVVLGLLLMPILALNAAEWPLALNTTVPALLLSVIFGFMLARSSYNELFALLVSALYGVCVVVLIAAINEPGELVQGLTSVFTRAADWLVDAATGGINQDDLVFTLLVATLFWFLAYNAVWHIFRIDRTWRVILPPALILITNSIFYSGSVGLDLYLIVFMFFALLLIVRSNLDAREWDWYSNGIRTTGQVRRQFLRVGAGLSLVVLVLAWGAPSGDLQERLDRFQEFLQSNPLTQIAEFWNRLFSTIEAQGPATADYYGGDSLQLGGAIRLGEQEVFFVNAPPGRRYYWRSRVFAVYDRGNWLPDAERRRTDNNPFDIFYTSDYLGARIPIQQSVTMALNTSRLIYAAPQPSRVELGTIIDLSYTPEQSMNVSVIRPQRVLSRGDTYSVTSLMTIANAGQLRGAGSSYPQYILDAYLPANVTPRTRDLAQQIVTEAGAVTPYDQAKAVESWLRANITYNEAIPQPPDDIDPVEWFLFELREGYCNYYASSMILMLRSLGIPARMAAGFAQGQFDASTGQFVVRERDAHTWVEVYFPGYGWIEFEPTSAQQPLDREGDEQDAVIPPQQSDPPTPTPSPTPQPTVTPTQDALSTPPPAENESRTLPTLTPTFTPSPTATPIIVPTQPPPMRQEPQGLLAYLLPALGILLLIVLLIVLLLIVGVFLWWWWEWRGLRGMSPVSRAYARLERFIALIGIRFNSQQTPDERRKQVAQELPPAEAPVTAITRLYMVERYGPGPQNAGDVQMHEKVAGEAWGSTRGSILRRYLQRFLPFRRRQLP